MTRISSILRVLYLWIFLNIFLILFSAVNPGTSSKNIILAEDQSKKVTIEDSKREAREEAGKIDEHAKELKQGVKEDSIKAGKTVKQGIKSGFQILKEGVHSLRRGDGVKAEKTSREEQNPQDEK
jgi:hypothetical protein